MVDCSCCSEFSTKIEHQNRTIILKMNLSGSNATTWTLFEYSSMNEPFRLFNSISRMPPMMRWPDNP